MTAPDPIVIVGAARTPMGGFQGELKDVPAPGLGGAAIRAALHAAGSAAQRIADDFHQQGGFGGIRVPAGFAVFLHDGVDEHLAPRKISVKGLGFHETHRPGERVVAGGQNGFKRAIDPIHQRRPGAEIDPEREVNRPDGAQPMAPHPEKQADVGFPEPVNGLHGVSHQEQGIAVAGPPALHQMLQQFKL